MDNLMKICKEMMQEFIIQCIENGGSFNNSQINKAALLNIAKDENTLVFCYSYLLSSEFISDNSKSADSCTIGSIKDGSGIIITAKGVDFALCS